MFLKIDFQPSFAKANNLRLQQPHFGHLSTAATVRVHYDGIFFLYALGGSVSPIRKRTKEREIEYGHYCEKTSQRAKTLKFLLKKVGLSRRHNRQCVTLYKSIHSTPINKKKPLVARKIIGLKLKNFQKIFAQ